MTTRLLMSLVPHAHTHKRDRPAVPKNLLFSAQCATHSTPPLLKLVDAVAMPWPKNSVPKFGDWDNNEGLSYSIVFDKARAEKEIFLLTSQEDEKDFSLHQNMFKTPDLTIGKRTSHASPDKSLGMGTRDPGDNSLKSPSGHDFLTGGRISGGQKKSSNFEVDPWNTSDGGPAYSSFMPSLGHSRHPMPMGLTKDEKVKESRVHTSGYHVDPLHEMYHERIHSKPAISSGPGRQIYQGNPAAAKIMRYQQRRSKNSNVPENTVPRFGDWDASDASSGSGFTEMFNKARDEKKSKSTPKTTGKNVSPLRPDEDLYKRSQTSTTGEKRKGWLKTLCCLDPHS